MNWKEWNDATQRLDDERKENRITEDEYQERMDDLYDGLLEEVTYEERNE